MRRSSLAVSIVLLFSAAIFAQHSSGGGGGGHSGGSSGGGSHSSASGSSSSSHSVSSSSSHSTSSCGSSTGSASSHRSSANGSASIASRTKISGNDSNAVHAVLQPKNRVEMKAAHSEKRTFFSYLRHPFRKPERKPVADLRRPVCLRAPCPVCPMGQVRSGGGCVGAIPVGNNNSCLHWGLWHSGACLQQTHFLDDCSGLRATLHRQAQRLQAATAAQQGACGFSQTQECSESTANLQSEDSLYRKLQERYQRCMGSASGFPYDGFAFGGSRALLFDRVDPAPPRQ